MQKRSKVSKDKDNVQKEVLIELQKYIEYMNPGFSNLPENFQDIVINAFVAGFTAKAMIDS